MRLADVFLGAPADILRLGLGAKLGVMVLFSAQLCLPQQFLKARSGLGFSGANGCRFFLQRRFSSHVLGQEGFLGGRLFLHMRPI